MAQAPPSGPPRKTTTLKQFSTMASQNERFNTKPDEFFWLENIMRVAPHKLHSVPGPRSIQTYPIVQPTCPNDFPAAQSLAVVCCYNAQDVWANSAGAFCFVAPDESFICTSSEASGFGQGPYPVSSPLMWRLWKPTAPTGPSCALTDITATEAVPMPGGISAGVGFTQGAQAGWCGKDDEKSYCLVQTNITPTPHPFPTFYSFTYFGESTGAVFMGLDINCGAGTEWTKFGSDFYSLYNCVATTTAGLAHWNMPAGGDQTFRQNIYIGGVSVPGNSLFPLSDITNIYGMQATASFLWVLVNHQSGLTYPRLYKLDKSTFAQIATYDITDPLFANVVNFDVKRDADLIFLIAPVFHFDLRIGYFRPDTAATVSLGTCSTNCLDFFEPQTSPSTTSAFLYKSNNFWASTSKGNIVKFGPLVCPSNPNIPWENL